MLNLHFDKSVTPPELYTLSLVPLILSIMVQMLLVLPNMYFLCASLLSWACVALHQAWEAIFAPESYHYLQYSLISEQLKVSV
jgi:hypothetical protein